MNSFFTESQFCQLPGLLLWKNLDSSYRLSNLNTAKIFGFKDVADIIGIMDYDIRCKAAENAHIWIAQDQQVIDSRKKLNAIDVHSYANDEIKAVFYEKAPLVFDNHVVGVQCISHELDKNFHRLLHEQLLKKNKVLQTYYIVSRFTEFDLTVRESECLYFFMRGKSTNIIANTLSLSPRTVESHTERIKQKMQCKNKPEFVEKAINLNLNMYILRSLVDKDII